MAEHTKLSILRAARQALCASENWCQGALVEYDDGTKSTGWVGPDDLKRVCKRCLVGAIILETPRLQWEEASLSALAELKATLDVERLDVWNDDPDRTFDEVAKALDDTITRVASDPLAEVF